MTKTLLTLVAAFTQEVLQTLTLTKGKAVLVLTVGQAMAPAASFLRAAPPKSPVPGAAVAAEGKDVDSDGDGLSDYQEVHKYHTDPRMKDTAGAGVSDGDWDQRRQFTYTVRSVIRVMPPVNLKALNDDYQDVRILAERDNYIELEVISYPLNTNAEAIRGNPNWKKDYAQMKAYLAPGVTTNWDVPMQTALLREVRQHGIDPDRLTDKELVERVSKWLFTSSQYRYVFGTYFTHFPDGKPAILPGLEAAFDREKGDRGWTPRQQFEHELLGKEMFANKSYGTCTSAAVYLTTVLRALGIPTRMIITIPVADPCDEEQLAMVGKNLKHHQVRSTIYHALLATGYSFAAHTYNEVYVGHRWRRLNYHTLGQNILDRNYLGLMVKVHEFRDLSEANLASTWGRRYGLGKRDSVFKYGNPYRTMQVSDVFGRYARVGNPPAKKREHHQITITKAYWLGSADTPAVVKSLGGIHPEDGAGHLLIHGDEWFDEQSHVQYKVFMKQADKIFVFRAKGQPDVKGALSMSFWTQASEKVRELEVVIPAKEYAKMAKGVDYAILPSNTEPIFQWKVYEGVRIRRE
jgi:hypothetical protein